MSADSPRRNVRGVPAIVPPQVVSDRSIIDSVAGFINDVTLAHQPQCDPKDTITWARFETTADISDSRFGDDWELEGNVAPPLLLILGFGQGVQVWAIPANGEAVEVLSWRHGIVSALRVLPTPTYAENGRADEPIDAYSEKRPLMAICDGTTPAGSNPQFCAVNFISLKTGVQVKTIKFKNPVLDILANRSSIVITFHERIAVFDARSLDDRLSVTTCFPSPGINPNPVALGSRWMAYSENKLLHSKRSGGGCDGDGVASYTATVLNAAKSFGKGLRELGEQVAAGLTGTSGSGLSSKSSSFDSASGDVRQPGVVTILDIKHPIKDVSPTSGTPVSINGSDPIVAHFIAHSEAVVAMEFDNSGMMLLTADRRGHDFHLFRIQPHPVGSSLAAVHHLYVLHRGDTSAKVQNITFSLDSRWVAVSTLRGTTHVFPVTPYGGPAGVRTHTSLHVVNKLSRFHRSAGLTADGRSSSPISHSDSTNFCQMLMPYHNPTLPPFPRPTVVLALAQLRQPCALGSPPGSAAPSSYSKASNTRQRLSSLSDDNGKPLSVCAVFAKSRSWLLDPPNAAREAPHKIQRKAVDSLFVMAGHGALIQYDLDTKLATNVAKEKICDDTPIELEVEAKAQWNLGRKDGSLEIMPPLLADNWLVKDRNSCMLIDSTRQFDDSDDRSDSWLSQVEIITHAGPHRRLWMGPQFVFKTYNTPSGSNLSHIDVEAVEIGVSPGPSTTCRPERSSPLNMPLSATGRSTVPVLIESGSYSSIEQSPKLMDRFRHEHMNSDFSVAHGDSRLKEDLADAMRESPSVSHKDTGGHPQRCRPSASGSNRATASSSSPSSSPKARSGVSGGVSSTSSSSSSSGTLTAGGGVAGSSTSAATLNLNESLDCLMQQEQQQMKTVSIEKVVNPLGTVTTITGSCDSGLDSDDVMKGIGAQDYVIHENCDESLFRPVVAIFCDEASRLEAERLQEDDEYTKPPEAIGNKLIVPVIEKAVDIELTKKESLKNRGRRQIQLAEDVKEDVSDVSSGKLKKTQVKEKPGCGKDDQLVKKQSLKTSAKKSSYLDDNSEDVVMVSLPDISSEKKSTALPTSRDAEPEVAPRKPSSKSSREEVSVVSLGLKAKSAKIELPKKKVDGESKSKCNPEEMEVDNEPTLGRPRDEKVVKKQTEPKSLKPRKTVDVESSFTDVSTLENLLDEAAKPLSGRKGSVTEVIAAKKEEEPKRKISKGRKSEEREVGSLVKSSSIKPQPVVEEKMRLKEPKELKSVRDVELGSTEVEETLKDSKITKINPKAKQPVATKIVSDTDAGAQDSSTKLKPLVMEEPLLRTKKNVPIKEPPKPISNDDFEDEKPIEFKRMTALPALTPSTSKSSNKGVKSVDRSPASKVDSKSEALEKKVKLEKGSSVESSDSVETKASKVPHTVSADGKETSKVVDQTEVKGLVLPIPSKKKSKAELKKKSNDDAKTSETALAVELSNVSVLADSLLDLLPDKPEEESPLRDVEKLKGKQESTEPKADLVKEQKSKPKAVKSATADRPSDVVSPAPPSVVAEREIKKTMKKTKTYPPSESATEVLKIEEPIDLDLKVTVNKKDAIITVEEKTTEESRNQFVTSITTLDTKSKSKTKLKSEKPAIEATKKSKLPVEDPVVEPKSSRLFERRSSEFNPPPAKIVSAEKKVKCDEVKVQEDPFTKHPKEELSKADKTQEMTGSKIVIEPIKVDTFLNDLIDSQKATKSKSSPTESVKSEESPKKSVGSPLKFVDTYVESVPAPETPTKKEKGKKKLTPGKAEKLTDKPEASNQQKSPDGIQFFEKFLQETNKPAVEQPTPWKSLLKTDEQSKPTDIDYPTLGKPMKSKKYPSPPAEGKKKTSCIADASDKENPKEKKPILDDVPSLQPLDLPIDFLVPLPPLEPLEGADENISLINFESPLQEASKAIKSEPEKSSPHLPKGLSSDTIIFALCGSLHYENENSAKPVDSPLTLSFSDSTAHTTAEYKSLTENDDQYLSLEQSSQENPPSTSSSTCEDITEAAYSSGGGDKSAIASEKTKNKQRRKKQLITAAQHDDEELRPLIIKNDEANLMTCSLTASKPKPSSKTSAAMIKKETLPSLDNNQVNSDSSSSDQATTSEDPDDQICLNVHGAAVSSSGVASASVAASSNSTIDNRKSADEEPDLSASLSVQSPQKSPQSQQQQQPNSSKKKLKRRKNQVTQHHTSEGGTQSIDHIDGGDLSSSSLSTGSRASLDPPSSSPTMSITGDNLMHFPADSSGSL